MHWFWQLAPPLVYFTLVFVGMFAESGNLLLLVFLVPFVALGGLVSIFVNLLRFKRRKLFLVRPAVTFMFALALINQSSNAHDLARKQAMEEARALHDQCRRTGNCPSVPSGWTCDSVSNSWAQKEMGGWMPVRVSYRAYANDGFAMAIPHPLTPMMEWVIRGGTQEEVKEFLVD